MEVEEVVVEEKVNAMVGREALWIQMVIIGHMFFASHEITLVKPTPPKDMATQKRRHETTLLDVSGITSIVN